LGDALSFGENAQGGVNINTEEMSKEKHSVQATQENYYLVLASKTSYSPNT
jgi:hypothetical protein